MNFQIAEGVIDDNNDTTLIIENLPAGGSYVLMWWIGSGPWMEFAQWATSGDAQGNYTNPYPPDGCCPAMGGLEFSLLSTEDPCSGFNVSASINNQQTCDCDNEIGVGSASILIDIQGGTGPYLTTSITSSLANDATVFDDFTENLEFNNGAGQYEFDVICGFAGSVSIVIEDANGCESTATVQIPTFNDGNCKLEFDAEITQNICADDCIGEISINVTNGDAPYIYDWSNGESTDTISNLCAGNYSVTVTDNNGYTETQSYTITSGALNPILTGVVSDVSIFGASDGSITTNVTATPPVNYNWSNGESTPNLTGIPAGIYTLDIVDGNGCQTNSTFEVLEGSCQLVLTVTDIVHATDYDQVDGSATINISGGIGPYTILVVGPNGYSEELSSTTVSNLAVGVYMVFVVDDNGCTGNTVFTISTGDCSDATATESINEFINSILKRCDCYIESDVPTIIETTAVRRSKVGRQTYRSKTTLGDKTIGSARATGSPLSPEIDRILRSGCLQSLQIFSITDENIKDLARVIAIRNLAKKVKAEGRETYYAAVASMTDNQRALYKALAACEKDGLVGLAATQEDFRAEEVSSQGAFADRPSTDSVFDVPVDSQTQSGASTDPIAPPTPKTDKPSNKTNDQERLEKYLSGLDPKEREQFFLLQKQLKRKKYTLCL